MLSVFEVTEFIFIILVTLTPDIALVGGTMSRLCFSLRLSFQLNSFLISLLLGRCESIIPLLHILHSSWSSNNATAINLLLLINRLSCLSSLPILHVIDKNSTHSLAFLGGLEVILQKFIHILITYEHWFLLVKADTLVLSLLINNTDHLFHFVMV